MIEYRIMGVPKRIDNINKLKEQLTIDNSNVFLDTEYKHNPMWTWKQVVSLPINDNVSHLCIIQDDALLCDNFTYFCDYLVSRFQDSIWMLYYTRKFNELPNGCLFSANPFCGGVVTIIPVKYLNSIIDFQETNYPDCIHDDLIIKYWSHKNGIKIMSTKPIVVDTFEESELGHSYHQNNIMCFNPIGKKWANASNVNLSNKTDWNRLEPMQFEKGSVCVNGLNATRLGNIMFQCAAAKTYAVRNGLSFKGFVPTGRQLKKLSDNVKDFVKSNVGFLRNDSGCEFSLNGYFQDVTSIDKNVAIDMFKIPSYVKEFIDENYGDVSNYVSVNVRRGDYLNKNHIDKFHVYSKEELDNIMNKYFKGEKFIFSSDDIEWCKENYRDCLFVDKPCEFKELVDLYIQTLCKGNIISCSSFSWWGAFLNQNNPKVVCHTPWYKIQEECDKMNVDNLIPKEWIKEP